MSPFVQDCDLNMIGYVFFRAGNFAWRRHHGALVPLEMPHRSPEDDTGSLCRLLISKRAAFIRWDERFDGIPPGEWWHVIKDVPENLSKLRKKTRWQIKRGGECYRAAPAQSGEIYSEGFSVYASSFVRYATFEKQLSAHSFRDAIEALPEDTEFWGVRDKETGQLVAFSENLVRDGACLYLTIWFEPEALKRYSGYLLIHEMNKHYLNERGLKYVSDGARSISHETSVHEFLEHKFGFRRAYARLRVVYAPGVGLAVRLLFPFRRLFADHSTGVFQKLAVLLEQERIRRACASESATH